jgi:hypothetical protein
MKRENLDEAMRKSSAEPVKQGGGCCGLGKLGHIDTELVDDMSNKIGDLWLMISLT